MEKQQEIQQQDLTALFGDSASQENLESFLTLCPEEWEASEVQGTTILCIIWSMRLGC